jgi:mRNA interferase YafQ
MSCSPRSPLPSLDAHCQDYEPLEPRYRDHQLTGNLADFRECHIEPDWLLIYQLDTLDDKPALFLTGTGTHSDLFR